MTTRITRAVTTIALAAGVTLAAAGVADARNNPPREDWILIDDEFTDVDPFLTGLCGFEITFGLDAHGWVRFRDNRVHATEQGSFVLTNTANGKTLTNEWAGMYKGQSDETFNEDGTLTITFRDQNLGIPERWRDHDGKVLIFDRGRAVFEGTIVIDLETDTVISEEVDFTTNGPHPILDQGFLDPLVACELLA